MVKVFSCFYGDQTDNPFQLYVLSTNYVHYLEVWFMYSVSEFIRIMYLMGGHDRCIDCYIG